MARQGMDCTMPDSMYKSHRQYGEDGGGSIGSRSNLSTTSGSKCRMEDLTANETYNDLADDDNKGVPRVSIDNHEPAEDEDEMTKENEAAVTEERRMFYEENTNRLRSILENIKNSTKTVLQEMNVYLQEMEEVEKTYIRCRAKTQKESRRLEQVEPDVGVATARYLKQASAQLFGNVANGGFDMAAAMGATHGASAGAS